MTDTPPPTDTPATVTVPPPTWMERIKTLIGDLARPFAIYATAIATAVAIMGDAGADKIGAAALLLVGLYTGKAWENQQQAQATAKVEVAKADADASVAKAQADATASVDIAKESAAVEVAKANAGTST